MDSQLDYWTARALLEWQVEAGADEAICDAPIDRYALADTAPLAAPAKAKAAPGKAAPPPPPPPKPKPEDELAAAVAEAKRAAAAVGDLAALAEAMAAYPHCDLRQGARNTVVSDGNPAARVMVIGEAPGRDEDREGRPFVGRAGQLLDRMFAAIGLARGADAPEAALYISNVMPWRPPANRTPEPGEIAMMLPFLERHVALAQPEVIVLMGNTPCQALLGRGGITRLRGGWTEALGLPVMPMFHPAYLLRQPAAKREAWADLLAVKARLMGGG